MAAFPNSPENEAMVSGISNRLYDNNNPNGANYGIDENRIFGNYVAERLRTLDEEILTVVKSQIEMVLNRAGLQNDNNIYIPTYQVNSRNSVSYLFVPQTYVVMSNTAPQNLPLVISIPNESGFGGFESQNVRNRNSGRRGGLVLSPPSPNENSGQGVQRSSGISRSTRRINAHHSGRQHLNGQRGPPRYVSSLLFARNFPLGPNNSSGPSH